MFRTRAAGVLAAGLAVALLAACGSDGGADGDDSTPAAEGRGSGDDVNAPEEDDGEGDAEDEAEDEADDDGRTGELPETYDFTPDPDRVPQNAEEAQQLTRNAQLDENSWWPGMEPHDPYENAGTWTVLPEDCSWIRTELPDHVLDSFTRRLDVPAEDGKGVIQATATISVHRTVEDAEREMEDTLDESFRCPRQDLGGGQTLSGLMSMPMADEDVLNADASLFEAGQYTPAGSTEAHDYIWSKSRIGMVTTAISVKGAEGYEINELLQIAALGGAQVLYNIELELQ